MIDTDSWSAIFAPPPNETLAERQARIAQQQEAAKISKDIDDAIEKSRKLFEKRKKAIKVLLLGPSIFFTYSPNLPPPRPSRVRQVHHAQKYVSSSPAPPSAHPSQTFSWPFVLPTSIARFQYGRSSSSSTSSGTSLAIAFRASSYSSTAPSRGCLPSSKTNWKAHTRFPPRLPVQTFAPAPLPSYPRTLATIQRSRAQAQSILLLISNTIPLAPP